jgi:hypothetical protein
VRFCGCDAQKLDLEFKLAEPPRDKQADVAILLALWVWHM